MFVFLGMVLSGIFVGVCAHVFGWESLLITVPASVFIVAGAESLPNFLK